MATLAELGYQPVRIYSAALNFPRMIGKGLNGERLPGGPYLVIQFVGGGAIFMLSGVSAYLFPIYNPLINLGIGVALAMLVGGALAAVPTDGISMWPRVLWLFGLLVSVAPTTSEPMPTHSPVALIGGDVMLLEPPRRYQQSTPPTRTTNDDTYDDEADADEQTPFSAPVEAVSEARAPRHAAPAGYDAEPITEPLPVPGPASSTAAASVFGALAGNF